jgi:hypothetical protein
VTTATWHLDAELLERYAAGRLQLGLQSSIEAHLVSCALCQSAAAEQVGRTELDPIWDAIVGEIDAPRLPFGLRLLARVGVGDSDAVVLQASANGLYRPWVASVVGAIAFAFLAGTVPARFQLATVLLVAPLVPLLAVLVAYDKTDPLRALAVATPASKFRIMLLRTAAAAATAVPFTLAVTFVVPGLATFSAVWLLPALLLTLVALTLLSWCSARVSGSVVGGAWAVFVFSLRTGASLQASRTSDTQLLFLAAALLAAVLLIARTRAARPSGGLV